MLLHELLFDQARLTPEADALSDSRETLSYSKLAAVVYQQAEKLIQAGLQRQQRVAIYLPKQIELATLLLATSLAGGVFVPINPLLKPDQVAYILRNCSVSLLLTSLTRADLLKPVLDNCPELDTVIPIEALAIDFISDDSIPVTTTAIDTDMVAILYTSGSSGQPKG
ncbi:MAG: AMP-binding protein, partial [Methylococcales bacterium]|nr:AMP-binding protein [Methylococcales bacterium]